MVDATCSLTGTRSIRHAVALVVLAGVGGIYVEAEVDTPFGDEDEDDFVVAGDAFVGILAKLGPIYAGVEGKYIVTDKTDLGVDLDGVAVTATAGLRF